MGSYEINPLSMFFYELGLFFFEKRSTKKTSHFKVILQKTNNKENWRSKLALKSSNT